jgi:hypothetical protein
LLFGGGTDHAGQVLVDERLAADEKEVADVVLDTDGNDIAGFLQGDAAALAGIEFVPGEPAKIALGVADIGDGELEEARSAVVEDFAGQLQKGLPFQHDRRGRGRRGGWRLLAGGDRFGGQHFHITAQA